MVSASDMRRELVLVGTQGLLNAGFVSDQGIDGGNASGELGGTILSLTEMGRNVIEVLREVEEASGP